ncbi:MAG TPA: hypothetical protein VGL27_14995 [Negativicutes bacterium]
MRCKPKEFICIISLIISIFGVKCEICSAKVDSSALYQETMWLSLDVSPEKKEQIDQIIAKSNSELKSNQKINKFDNMFNLMEYASRVNDQRTIVNDKIMELLSVRQQNIFEDQIETQQQLVATSTIAILGLDLTTKQQTLILNLLIESQQQVWSIISNKSLTWEERKRKLENLNTLMRISSLLTKSQNKDLKSRLESLKFVNKENL